MSEERPAERPRPRRGESFFGLHFDLHPSAEDTQLGADLTEELVAALLERVRPDFVQYDCKGHAGYTGYPTKVGWPSPGIVKDSLAIWRRVTRRYGVGLYVHYSGVWDSVAARQRPDWARVDQHWLPDRDMTSTYGRYVDELLIPQLKEIVDAYDVDGVWVDGDCWAVRPDYSAPAREAFRQATGLAELPRRPGDPGWERFLELQRRRFEDYVTRYVEALHDYRPQVQITSNWMYSARMPQPVRAPLDFLSGDYTPGEAVNSARLEARRFAAVYEAQGKPWDLMAWGFNYNPRERGERSLKTAVQLQQEASIVLAQGGGFQVYFKPTRAGWIDDPTIDVAAEVAAFCRERQAVSHQTRTVPQVALLLSETGHYHHLNRQGRLFATSPLRALEGMLHALLELHYSVDVVTEEQLLGPGVPAPAGWQGPNGSLAYPMVVVPEWERLGEGVVEALVAHVERGGSVLAVGAHTARLFEAYLGVRCEGAPDVVQANYVAAVLADGRAMPAWAGRIWQPVSLLADGGAEVAGRRYRPFELRGSGEIAATVTRRGRGQIGAIYGPAGTAHYDFHHPVTRAFIGSLMAKLFPAPLVEVDGPPSVDVALRRTGSMLLLHLSNVTGMQVAPHYASLDEVPAVGPLRVRLRLPQRPVAVTVVPASEGVEQSWDSGAQVVEIVLPRLEIHSVIVVS